jgi:mono/diheme cytochrome c family protein
MIVSVRVRRWLFLLGFVVLPSILIGAALFSAQGGFEALRVPDGGARAFESTPERVAHGEYLARLGNCITCHTTRGGEPYSGGRAFVSQYGTLYSTNITPDEATGIGTWSIDEFRHAMHHGVSRNGPLYPAFPFANFSRLADEDIDALFAFLGQVTPVIAPARGNDLEFPASRRSAIVAWRMLHYRPRPLQPDTAQSDVWNRGRYLVDGVGHCDQCHSGRGSQASLPPELYMAGGRIPGQDWYAPPLDRVALERWSIASLAGFLRSGTSEHGAAYGSMAEVIHLSLQYLTPDDAMAMATFLKTIPARARPVDIDARHARVNAAGQSGTASGLALYRDHCERCHEADGGGKGHDYPPLAGNPLVTSDDAINPIRLVLHGGVAPTTALNPRPYSMPSFADRLDDEEVAAVINHVRNSWNNQGSAVSRDDVRELRRLRLD